MITARLEIRPPVEADRERFVRLFCDPDFMVFSGGVLERGVADDRFDRMLIRAAELPFAKQPVIERSTGRIIGYSGADRFDFEGRSRLEYGYRLVPESRNLGTPRRRGALYSPWQPRASREKSSPSSIPPTTPPGTSLESSASYSGSRRR